LDKYLQNSSVITWLRRQSFSIKSASKVWSSLLRTVPIILYWISWRPGAGLHIIVGRDQILNLGEHAFLQPGTIDLLNQRSVTVLAHVKSGRDPITLADTWKNNADFGFTGFHETEWTNFISVLKSAGIYLNSQSEDSLILTGGDAFGFITVKNVYAAIVSTQAFQD
jgi:hypothetical protein